MSSSSIEIIPPTATNVVVTGDNLTLDLSDGRSISAPLAWYPRLVRASQNERTTGRLIGCGEVIHWPELDEDISVEALIAGRPSIESQQSFAKR